MTTIPASLRATALLASAGLVLAACTGSDDTPKAKPSPAVASTSESPTPTPTPTGPPPHLPLTGRVVAKGEVPKRPSLVVKVDNTGSASPQRGLGSADLVVEELVEGGRTRLAVFLHSHLPDVIGPVRSQRTSDVGIVKPTHGLLVASGAAGVVRRTMVRAGIHTRVEGEPGFFRDSSRPAPYNLMLQPRPLTHSAPRLHAPRDYLQWARRGDTLPKGRAVHHAAVRFSPYQTTRWGFSRGNGWRRTNGLAVGQQRFKARNLVILHVRTRDAGYRDPAGSYVPETVTKGHGKATLVHDGRAYHAVWHKKKPWSRFLLTTPTGTPLRVPAGRTWIELVPSEGGVSLS